MTHQERVQILSDSVASWMAASTIEELIDLGGEADPRLMSRNEIDRWSKAADEIQNRLWQMGEKRT